MKILTWNVNGIRAASRQHFPEWFAQSLGDIICLQETKAQPHQLSEALLHPLGYHSFWNSAQKPGYSGVALFCKKEPLRVITELNIPEIDTEGRLLAAEFASVICVNAYFPNSQREKARLPYKLRFCQALMQFCEQLRTGGKTVVLCGDLNIAHRELDLKNPKANQDQAGFLPEERQWLSQFLQAGWVDGFRYFQPNEGGHYTWWSYRPGVRARNIGWRLDYCLTQQESQDRLQSVLHQPTQLGSDHCPVMACLRD